MRKTIIAIVVLLFCNSHLLWSQQHITTKDIWFDYKFVPKFLDNIEFLSDNESYASLGDNSLNRCDAMSGDSIGVIIDFEKWEILKNKKINGFELSKNDSLILLETDAKRKFRNSKLSSFYLFDKNKNTLKPITKGNDGLDIAAINPKNYSVAFIKDNNIWISNNENSFRITKDGKQNAIKNGRTDWVYEEEFGFIRAFEWSPDGNMLAWIRFDETDVPLYTITNFDSIYPTHFSYKYPKAGYPNSRVSVHLYNCKTKKIQHIKIPNQQEYIPLIKWSIDGSMLAIQTLNRLQNHTIIYSYSIISGDINVIYEEQQDTYIPFPMRFTWLRDNKRFALITERNGFSQLCTFTLDGKLDRNITNWNFDVTDILAYDSNLDYLFFEAAEPDEMQRRIYRVRPDGSALGYITPEKGKNSDLLLSKDFLHGIYTNSNAQQQINIYSYDELKGRKSVLLSNNSEIDSITQLYDFVHKEFIKIPVDSVQLNAWIMKPKHTEGKRFPVLITIYAGPGHQEVLDYYNYTDYWYQYLVQNGVIVVSIDPRGTDGRGTNFRKCVYKQLGITQTNDLIQATKYLKTLSYVDSSTIGLFGWSFGGYQTLMCMAHSSLYKFGIAVAPVTDWKFYDNIYTERYMQTPLLNPEGYKKSSVLDQAKSLRGNLLLIHGDSDDNVHIQHSYALCKQLNQINYPYQFLVFPGKNHSISGRPSRYKLFDSISEFIKENVQK